MNRRIGYLLAGAALLGLVAGLLSPPPRPQGARADEEILWRLPDAATLARHAQADANTVASLRWEGGRPDAAGNNEVEGDEPAATSAWRLVGIVSGNGMQALVLPADGGAVQRLARDGILPDGAVITDIGRNHIELLREGCRLRRQLHHHHSQEEPLDGDSCPTGREAGQDPTGSAE